MNTVFTKRKIRVILTQRIIKAPEFLVHFIIALEFDCLQFLRQAIYFEVRFQVKSFQPDCGCTRCDLRFEY